MPKAYDEEIMSKIGTQVSFNELGQLCGLE